MLLTVIHSSANTISCHVAYTDSQSSGISNPHSDTHIQNLEEIVFKILDREFNTNAVVCRNRRVAASWWSPALLQFLSENGLNAIKGRMTRQDTQCPPLASMDTYMCLSHTHLHACTIHVNPHISVVPHIHTYAYILTNK